MKKNTGKIIGVTAGIILALAAAAAGIFSMIVGKQVAEGLLYCNEGNDTKGNSVKQLLEWGYDLELFEEKYDNISQSVQVTAEDGNVVPAWIYQKEENRDTVILVHGHGGDHVSNAPLSEMYLENGWNVISFDQRASGDSPNDKVSFGYFEKLDVAALVDYAKEEMKSERVVVHGQSMGAATAGLYAATEHARRNAYAVVMDSSFENMKTMFLGVWRGMEGTEGIPEEYVAACGDWYLRLKYGFGFDDADVCLKMKENEVKTLMLHMTRDDLITTQKAQEMYENIATQEKRLVCFDSEHIKGIYDYPEDYREAVFTFLNGQ